jgi:hypothetical protein
MSVVDSHLKVYGIDNLRIADGSIMPRVTTGNTMAPCVIIGEPGPMPGRHPPKRNSAAIRCWRQRGGASPPAGRFFGVTTRRSRSLLHIRPYSSQLARRNTGIA